MPRRLVVLLTSARDISNSALLCALLQESGAHPLFFQSSAHSFCVYPGWHQARFSDPSVLDSSVFATATPLDATLTGDLRVLTEIIRNLQPISPLGATLTKVGAITPLDATLTKTGGSGCYVNHGAGWRSMLRYYKGRRARVHASGRLA